MIVKWLKWLFQRFDVDVTYRPNTEQEPAPSVVEKQITFKYKYMDFPFGEWKYFGVTAESQEEANEKAIERFRELFLEGYTVMTVFYPVKSK